MGELSKDDRNEYKAIVKYIKSNLETCFEVAVRLQRLKEGKLYREDYDTFEKCVQSEFSMERAHAYRLIQSVKIVENIEKNSKPVSPRGDKIDPPTQEFQTRQLVEAPPEKQPEAWAKAVEKADGKQPTAAQVKEAVKEVIEAEAVVPPLFAPSGQEVPDELRPAFESDLFDRIERVEKELNKIANDAATDPAGRELIKDMETHERKGETYHKFPGVSEIRKLRNMHEPFGIVRGDWVPKHVYTNTAEDRR